MNLRQILVQVLAPSPVFTARLRRRLYTAGGLTMAVDVRVESRSLFKAERLVVGAGTFVNHGVFVDQGPLDLGRHVAVGPGVRFLTTTHELADSHCRAGAVIDAPIVVGDGAWIGAGAMIIGPAAIAPGCVVAAGAVLTGDTAPDGLYAGVPARRVRDLPAQRSVSVG
jgi:maltose O-acetyltransferase